jgi:hypothetical protein
MKTPQSPKSAAEIIRFLAHAVNEHFTDDVLRKIHIKTQVEPEIVFGAQNRRIVILTGNPGDGKTHLIRCAQAEHDLPSNTTIVLDANQLEAEEVVKTIQTAMAQDKPLVMAINEGILLQACQTVESRYPWAKDVVDALLHPYCYGESDGEPKVAPDTQRKPVIYDLTRRNNLTAVVVRDALDRITNLALEESTPMRDNAQRLRSGTTRQRLCSLLDVVGQTGLHATMRDLYGFLAHLLSGGEDEVTGSPPQPYYLNAFEGGEGPLFSAVRRLDPVRVPAPFLDDALFEDEDEPADWLAEAPEDYKCERDPAKFQRRKRRAFFEHRAGKSLLRDGHNDVYAKLSQLRDRSQSPEYVAVSLLNRFFDSSSATGSEQLVLWFSHRYHARPVRYLASSSNIPTSAFTVRIPRLQSHLQKAFPNHYADHVVFVHRSMPTDAGLVMDARLIGQLLDGDRISGLGVRDPEAQARVASFYDRLARNAPQGAASVVRILRADTMQQVSIGINPEKRSYFIPGDLA